MEYYKSGFSIITVDEEQKLVCQLWNNETEKMTDDEFKKEMLNLAKAFEKYLPKKVFVNQKVFKFVVSIELQAWVNENVNVKLINAKTEKLAFVVSDELFAAVSVEQTLDDVGGELAPKFFDDADKAKKWLNIN